MLDVQRNRLAGQAALYLRQHADNPVHWQPWDDTAIEFARVEQRPILLSVGYSSCHWCHVMARESFSDPAVAAIANQFYVSIKVDREASPEIDRAYQFLHQVIQHQPGGWPLTAILEPHSLLPFFIGTYIPDTPRHGLPACADLLRRLHALFVAQPADILRQVGAIEQFLDVRQARQMTLDGTPETAVDEIKSVVAAPTDQVPEPNSASLFEQLHTQLDPQSGGLSGAPKFPMFPLWLALLDDVLLSPSTPRSRQALAEHLKAICSGGLYDHIGGGFFRYCVDEHWNIPHFEKMLDDNAQALLLLSRHASAEANHQAAGIVRETAGALGCWLDNAQGGYATALSAESAAGEGGYYVWELAQITSALPTAAAALYRALYGLDQRPNFAGAFHLRRHSSLAEAASKAGVDPKHAPLLLYQAQQTLLSIRSARPTPEVDNKSLCGGNGLALAGLSSAARWLGDDALAAQARACAQFCYRHFRLDKSLGRCWIAGQLSADAVLEDYAFMLQGLWEWLQFEFDPVYFDWALTLCRAIRQDFLDPQGLITEYARATRILPFSVGNSTEGATPGVIPTALRFCYLFGRLAADTQSIGWVEAQHAALGQMQPQNTLFQASRYTLQRTLSRPTAIVVICGSAYELSHWRQQLNMEYSPAWQLFFVEKSDHVLLRAAYPPAAGRALAYLCSSRGCQQFDDAANLRQVLTGMTITHIGA